MPDLQDAISLLENGDARAASELLEAMADEMPGYATAYVLLARAYEGIGEWKHALGSWREALHIVPNSPVIRRGLERSARKATSRAPVEELPELPSMSVSTPSPQDEEGAATGGFDVHLTPPAAGDDEATEPWRDEAGGDEPEADRAAGSEEARGEATEPTPEDQDLDRLIAELESARIVPRPDLDSLPEPELDDDIEDVVSVTLARIYASQGQYDEAARVYELLADHQPEKEAAFKAKAAEMRSKASED